MFIKNLKLYLVIEIHPISTLSLSLIEQALELEEDMYFSKISDKRLI